MPNFTYHTITVTGINDGDPLNSIVLAHNKAKELFEQDLVSELSSPGHNFLCSFCVFPCGSGNERESQMKHQLAIVDFGTYIKEFPSDLDWFLAYWSELDGSSPRIIASHDTE